MVNSPTFSTGFPRSLQFTDKNGTISPIWYQFLLQLYQRTGLALTGIESGDVLQAVGQATEWGTLSGSNFAEQAPNLVFAGPAAGGAALPTFRNAVAADFGNQGANLVLAGPSSGPPAPASFRALSIGDIDAGVGPQAANEFYAGPASGGAASPTFRLFTTADLENTEGQYPGTETNDSAAAGNIGEYIFSQIPIGSAVVLPNGTTTDITSIVLTAGNWLVWGNVVTNPTGSTTTSTARAWTNTQSATDPGPPNNGAYAQSPFAASAGQSQILPIGLQRITVASGTQTVYLTANVSWATATLTGYGFIGAIRPR